MIASDLANLIATKNSETTIIGGVATAGIPHAAWIADKTPFANNLHVRP